MSLTGVRLEDKSRLESGRAFLTGVQALARLPMLQARRDRAAGLDTAGYISGYRGSPLGGLDRALTEAAPFLDAHDIRFQPGVNEELAATAILLIAGDFILPPDGLNILWPAPHGQWLAAAAETVPPSQRLSASLAEIIARRRDSLVDYQNTAYARRYTELVERVSAAERALSPASTALAEAVAVNSFKLMAYKDEYEVARLFRSEDFATALGANFAPDARAAYHFAAAFLARRDPRTGILEKRARLLAAYPGNPS